MKRLYVRPETIKITEENIGSTLIDIAISNIYLDLYIQAKKRKAKIKQLPHCFILLM